MQPINKSNINLMKNDISYCGFLSARGMRILGYCFILLTQLFLLILFLCDVVKFPKWLINLSGSYEFLATLSLPILSFALFSIIISSRDNIKKCIVNYFIYSILIYASIVLIFDRYIVGFISILYPDFELAHIIAEDFVKSIFGSIINYNIFVDLFLFSLFFYFMICKPKNIKSKKALTAFKSLSLIPVIAIIVTSVLYALYNMEIINLPIEILPILPCRSITIYAIFFIIVILIKLRQKKLEKSGVTEEQYKIYLHSNKNSFRFSAISSIVILAISCLDFLISIIIPEAEIFGLGTSYTMVSVIPLILCFSYTKQPKNKAGDNIIRLIFVTLFIIMYLELFLYIMQPS